MKYIKSLLGLGLLLFTACGSDDGPSRVGNGGISATLDIDENVLSAVIPDDDTPSSSADRISIDDFSLSLRSADGVYAKTWDKFSDFPVDAVYNIGDYVMEASYGSIDKEGFDAAYYHGEQSLTIREAETTSVRIVCSLCNSMVSVSATEAFNGYFSDYTTLVHSDGGEYLSYAKDETKPVYVRPGNVSLTVTVTKPNGQTASFTPQTAIVALPQHHYRVKLDVNNGEMGVAQLVITFDDSTTAEDVVIDLSDELMSSPAPEIFTDGFVSGQPLAVVEGTAPTAKLSATISAVAGLGKVMLSSRVPAMQSAGIPSELDLMSATELQKAALEGLGLGVKGLWRNPDKMAEIDFTNLVANIHPADGDNAVFSLIAIDRYGKSSEPVSLVVDFSEVSFSAIPVSPIMVGDGTGSVKVTPSSVLADVAKVSLSGKISGRWIDLPITDISDDSGEWLIKFDAPDGAEALPVRVSYNGVCKCEIVVERVAPDFGIEVDPFASSAYVRVVHGDADVLAAIARQLDIVTASGQKLHIVKRDVPNGIVVVSGLQPSTAYVIWKQ